MKCAPNGLKINLKPSTHTLLYIQTFIMWGMVDWGIGKVQEVTYTCPNAQVLSEVKIF